MQVKVWVIAWYREQDWSDWCAVGKFTGGHKEWLARAEAGAKARERDGYSVAKVVIEPAKFIEWCRVNGREIDGDARTLYAISLLDDRADD